MPGKCASATMSLTITQQPPCSFAATIITDSSFDTRNHPYRLFNPKATRPGVGVGRKPLSVSPSRNNFHPLPSFPTPFFFSIKGSTHSPLSFSHPLYDFDCASYYSTQLLPLPFPFLSFPSLEHRASPRSLIRAQDVTASLCGTPKRRRLRQRRME